MTFLVSFDTHTLEDSGLGVRTFTGLGEVEVLFGRTGDFDFDRDLLLPLDDADQLLLRPRFRGDVFFFFVFVAFLLLAELALLERLDPLLLYEELPDDEPDEPVELERELELPLEELFKERKWSH